MAHSSCYTLYIHSLLVFVVKNGDLFSFNSEIHNLHTRFKNNLHLPSTNLTMVQKGVLYSGSKIFNYKVVQIWPGLIFLNHNYRGRTAAAQCGVFTHKSVPVIFEPPCTYHYRLRIDLKSFKRKLKNFLIDHTLYSLDEFYHLTSYDRCF
jgi:hypothetical protein